MPSRLYVFNKCRCHVCTKLQKKLYLWTKDLLVQPPGNQAPALGRLSRVLGTYVSWGRNWPRCSRNGSVVNAWPEKQKQSKDGLAALGHRLSDRGEPVLNDTQHEYSRLRRWMVGLIQKQLRTCGFSPDALPTMGYFRSATYMCSSKSQIPSLSPAPASPFLLLVTRRKKKCTKPLSKQREHSRALKLNFN